MVRILRSEFVRQPDLLVQFLDLSGRSCHFVHENLLLTREVRSFPEHEIYYTVRDYVEGVTL